MYSIEDLKSAKIVIDFRNVKDVDKLQKIVKTAYPSCIDLPSGIAEMYYINTMFWDTCPFNPHLISCTVNDIII